MGRYRNLALPVFKHFFYFTCIIQDWQEIWARAACTSQFPKNIIACKWKISPNRLRSNFWDAPEANQPINNDVPTGISDEWSIGRCCHGHPKANSNTLSENQFLFVTGTSASYEMLERATRTPMMSYVDHFVIVHEQLIISEWNPRHVLTG